MTAVGGVNRYVCVPKPRDVREPTGQSLLTTDTLKFCLSSDVVDIGRCCAQTTGVFTAVAAATPQAQDAHRPDVR